MTTTFHLRQYPHRQTETTSQSLATVVALADWNNKAAAGKSEQTIAPLNSRRTKADKKTGKKADPFGSRGRNRNIAVALGLVGLIAGAIFFGSYFFAVNKTTPGNKKSIAVLPFKPINTANRDEIYEIGIADSLIHRLSSMKGFVVRPLERDRKYADIEQDPLAAGREQQVDYVLASNYQLADGKIRITAQLFNVAKRADRRNLQKRKRRGRCFCDAGRDCGRSRQHIAGAICDDFEQSDGKARDDQ